MRKISFALMLSDLKSWRFRLTYAQVILAFRLALRELRGGLRGFWIFLACIALGVASIAGVSSVSRSIMTGVGQEGRTLLGGDVAFSLMQRAPKAQEIKAIEELGKVTSYATLRAQLVTPEEDLVFIQLKAVEENYPLVGKLITSPALSHTQMFGVQDGFPGMIADPVILARYNLRIGDKVRIGKGWFTIRASLDDEPDRIGSGIGFGLRVMIDKNALPQTELVQPGSIVRWGFNVVLPDHLGDERSLENIAERFKAQFADTGWISRTRMKASENFDDGIQRFTQFLTLVGLTALFVGGVGVANAVSAFINRKRMAVATFKSLGASGQFIVFSYMVQILLIAFLGVVLGLGIGASFPYIVAWALKSVLPVPLVPILVPGELFLAAVYGVLIALVFSLLPLGRAHDMSVTQLFRDQIEDAPVSVRPEYRAMTACAAVILLVLSLFAAYDRFVGLSFLLATLVCFVILLGVAKGIVFLARHASVFENAKIRLAIHNLYRPGALTSSLVLSLGLGITLLVVLSVVDANLRQQLTQTIAGRAPSFFFLDVPTEESASFDGLVKALAPDGELNQAPMMSGQILRVNGRDISTIKVDERIRRILNGDRRVTFSSSLPNGSRLVKGSWWDAHYSGQPLVSFEEGFASGIGLRVGDVVDISVMGIPVKAKVANLRRVDWASLSINFFMVFSPNTFQNVPHSQLVTVTFPSTPTPEFEAQLARDIAKSFPQVTSLRVKEILQAVNTMLGQMLLAIRGASSITLIASFLVLGGAMAASQRTRLREAVVLKTLGATRRTLLYVYLMEYLFLGLATALFGLIAGTAIAYILLSWVLKLSFSLLLGEAFLAAFFAVGFATVLGLIGTWRILNQKPAVYLREL